MILAQAASDDSETLATFAAFNIVYELINQGGNLSERIVVLETLRVSNAILHNPAALTITRPHDHLLLRAAATSNEALGDRCALVSLSLALSLGVFNNI